jgi:hypothetical protein
MIATLRKTAFLVLLTTGCATYETGRWVVVETHRVEVVSRGSSGLSDALAGDLFRDVAGKLGLPVEGPIQDPRTPQMIEYAAETPGRGSTNQIWLHLMAHDGEIIFSSKIYGSKVDLVRAERAATLFTHALDQHGVRYRVVKGSDPLFWGP